MSQELNLMPCPFCGAEPLMQEHPAHKHSIVDWPDHPGSWTIECPACECGMIHATKEGLLAAWNKRAQPAGEAEQRIADLEADVARLHSDKMALLEKYVYAAPPAAANQTGIPEYECKFQHEIAELVMRHIDRMNDVCEQDTAENIITSFTRQFDPIFGVYMDEKFPGRNRLAAAPESHALGGDGE